ncbi:MAG: sigma-70 family RNA polymerase sigma factor [Cytophagaceae bacterium]|nr:sigma-70 family RNA polymerase sigma factor [Cytophagaceae bacterium]
MSEKNLISLLKKKDQRGIEYLYDNYSSALYGVILRIVKSEAIAEEVLQDSFVKIWEKIDMYDESKGRLYTWILNLTRNLALDKLRSKDFKKQNKTDDISSFVSIKDSTDINPEFIGVKEVLNLLSPEQKQLIDLMYFKGYSQSEIAEEFGIPLGTIKTRVRAAMTKLRGLF